MSQEDLTLSLRRIRVGVGVGLAQLEVGLCEHERPALQRAKVVVRTRVEGQNMVPRGRRLRSCLKMSSCSIAKRRVAYPLEPVPGWR